eukprot:146343-Pyramimonas_sp.AAC.1
MSSYEVFKRPCQRLLKGPQKLLFRGLLETLEASQRIVKGFLKAFEKPLGGLREAVKKHVRGLSEAS